MADIKGQLNFDGAFKRVRGAVKSELSDLMEEAQAEMLRVIDVRDARASGDLEASIQTHLKDFTGGIRGLAGADAKPGSNVAPYAPFVDQPTRPHWPPIRPLERWAREKFGATGDEKTEIAFGAAWSISRRGTSGVRFTDAALRELKGEVAPRLEKAAANELTDG